VNKGIPTSTIVSSHGGLVFLERSLFVVVFLSEKEQNQKSRQGGKDQQRPFLCFRIKGEMNLND